MVLGSEEAVAISHAQKLLVIIYFSGPRLVKDHLLQSPVCAPSIFLFLFFWRMGGAVGDCAFF